MQKIRKVRKPGLSTELRRLKRMECYRKKNFNKRSVYIHAADQQSDETEQLTMRRFAERIEKENAERMKKNLPIAKYDVKLRRAYLEYADGSRKYAE